MSHIKCATCHKKRRMSMTFNDHTSTFIPHFILLSLVISTIFEVAKLLKVLDLEFGPPIWSPIYKLISDHLNFNFPLCAEVGFVMLGEPISGSHYLF